MAGVRRATAAATQQYRRSFLFGYAAELSRMFSAAAEAAQHDVHPSSATLPALRARERQVAEFARQRFGRTVTARAPAAAQAVGWDAGRAAAANADLGRQRVGEGVLRAIGSGR